VAAGDPGVLLLGSDFKALGVVRSLARHGVRVALVDNLPRSAWFSRFVTRRYRWRRPMYGDDFVEFLLGLARRERMQGWVLLPAQDEVLELIARHHERLGVAYRLVTQPWPTLRWAYDKRLLHEAADDAAVDRPRTWYPADEGELGRMPLSFPVIIKPADSILMQYSIGRKAMPAKDHAELLERYRFAAKIVAPDLIMVQEIVDAEAQYSVAAFSEEGRLISAMTARRTRQYPIDYGLSSSFVEAIEVPGLIEPAQRILRRLGVTGMVEVEFIQDRRDSKPKLIDVNPRPWGWHALCIGCGLDFPRMQYEHVLGRPVAHVEPRYGRRWIRVLTDVPAGLQSIRTGALSPRAYLSSLRGPTVFSVFDVRDPVPAGGDLAMALLRTMNSVARRRTLNGLAARPGLAPLEKSAG
jgi:predicted ATP-grasp superfamily ATP-dependent carboligase